MVVYRAISSATPDRETRCGSLARFVIPPQTYAFATGDQVRPYAGSRLRTLLSVLWNRLHFHYCFGFLTCSPFSRQRPDCDPSAGCDRIESIRVPFYATKCLTGHGAGVSNCPRPLRRWPPEKTATPGKIIRQPCPLPRLVSSGEL